MVLLHSFLKTWGEFLRRLLALAKRRRMRDYDAVTLSAACNSPVLITEGLAGVRGKYGSKIEIRYNGPDLCVQYRLIRPIHVVLMIRYKNVGRK